jgi:hypothetical protein
MLSEWEMLGPYLRLVQVSAMAILTSRVAWYHWQARYYDGLHLQWLTRTFGAMALFSWWGVVHWVQILVPGCTSEQVWQSWGLALAGSPILYCMWRLERYTRQLGQPRES